VTKKNIVLLKDVSFRYLNKYILKDVNFSLSENDFCIIKGKSGEGKTTVLNLITGILKPQKGKITVFGKNIVKMKNSDISKIRNKKIGVVFQNYLLENEFSVLENILLPITINRIPKEKDIDLVKNLLNDIELSSKIDEKVKNLSGGQIQRVALARAFANNPDLVIMDEPTSNLDNKTSEKIVKLIFSMYKKYNKTFLIVSHENYFDELNPKTYLIGNKNISKLK